MQELTTEAMTYTQHESNTLANNGSRGAHPRNRESGIVQCLIYVLAHDDLKHSRRDGVFHARFVHAHSANNHFLDTNLCLRDDHA